MTEVLRVVIRWGSVENFIEMAFGREIILGPFIIVTFFSYTHTQTPDYQSTDSFVERSRGEMRKVGKRHLRYETRIGRGNETIQR